MSVGGGSQVQSGPGWNRQQRKVGGRLEDMINNALQGPLDYMPATSELDRVYDPALTEDYFQKSMYDPIMNSLTGRGGTLAQIGAAQAGRGTYFSSGRQQAEADAVLGAQQQLAQGYAGLVGQDMATAQAEWMRRDPYQGQMTQQALNFLGTPMLTAYQEQPSPWGQIGGAVIGGTAGFLVGGPAGAMVGAGIGGGVGGAL